MNFTEFNETYGSTPYTRALSFAADALFLRRSKQPLGVLALKDGTDSVVRLPNRIQNIFGRPIAVSEFSESVFRGNGALTVLILPTALCTLPFGAFSGCKALKQLYLPRGLRFIPENAFAGCDALEDIYYAGTRSDWQKVRIAGQRTDSAASDSVVPASTCGNAALLNAVIHFNCQLSLPSSSTQYRLSASEETAPEVFFTV